MYILCLSFSPIFFSSSMAYTHIYRMTEKLSKRSMISKSTPPRYAYSIPFARTTYHTKFVCFFSIFQSKHCVYASHQHQIVISLLCGGRRGLCDTTRVTKTLENHLQEMSPSLIRCALKRVWVCVITEVYVCHAFDPLLKKKFSAHAVNTVQEYIRTDKAARWCRTMEHRWHLSPSTICTLTSSWHDSSMYVSAYNTILTKFNI